MGRKNLVRFSLTAGMSERTLTQIARLLTDAPSESIVVLCGAGVSVACGIPDFRTPGSGLYSRLESYHLPTPTSMFQLSYYVVRPRPFAHLSQHIYPSYRYKPSWTHHFFHLLHRRGKLSMVFTQNIDDLESLSGTPAGKVLQCHGSYRKGLYCLGNTSGVCTYKTPSDCRYRAACIDNSVSHCPQCGNLMKPFITFFGEPLPDLFKTAPDLIADAGRTKLVLVMGTSLNVSPFNYLPQVVSKATPRVMINREPAGYLEDRLADLVLDASVPAEQKHLVHEALAGRSIDEDALNDLVHAAHPNDSFLQGDCDDHIVRLAKACGWYDELRRLKETTDCEFESLYQQESALMAADTQADRRMLVGPRVGLTLVVFRNALIVPTAAELLFADASISSTINIKNHSCVFPGMLGVCTDTQLGVLERADCLQRDTYALFDATQLPAEVFEKLMASGPRYVEKVNACEYKVLVADKLVARPVYAPVNGHWASYCTAFVGAVSREPAGEPGGAFVDCWDMITRWPGVTNSPDDDALCFRSTRFHASTPDLASEERGLVPVAYSPPHEQAGADAAEDVEAAQECGPSLLGSERSTDSALFTNEYVHLGVVASTQLSRKLAGAPDHLADGEAVTVDVEPEDSFLHMRFTVIPKYLDEADSVVADAQRKVSSIKDGVATATRAIVTNITFTKTESSEVHMEIICTRISTRGLTESALSTSVCEIVTRKLSSLIRKVVPLQ